MDSKTLLGILPNLPSEATEIVIRGQNAVEVFFSMPASWRPSSDRIWPAPNGLYYKRGVRRWRVS